MAAQSRAPFADVDGSGRSAAVADYLERVAAMPEFARVHAAERELVPLRAGLRVLDAGCGLGTAAEEIALAVGPSGSVTGVDLSSELLEQARRRHDPARRVTYEQGDVTALAHPSGSFDVVRCERVLQHLRSPETAVAELVRVAAPGGTVVLVDSDWGSLVIDVDDPDLVEAVLRVVLGRMVNPLAGRCSRRLLLRAGCRDVVARPVPLWFTDLGRAALLLPLLDRTLPVDVPPEVQPLRERWFDTLDRVSAEGTLWVSCTPFVTVGRAPG